MTESFSGEQDSLNRDLARYILRSASGDKPAFHKLYQRSYQILHGVICTDRRSHSDCRDKLEQIYLVIWRKADQFDPGKMSALTWILSEARKIAPQP